MAIIYAVLCGLGLIQVKMPALTALAKIIEGKEIARGMVRPRRGCSPKARTTSRRALKEAFGY